MSLGLERQGRRTLAIAAALIATAASGGCLGPNPAFRNATAVDASEAGAGKDFGGWDRLPADGAPAADAAPGDGSVPVTADGPAPEVTSLPPDTAPPPPDTAPLPPDTTPPPPDAAPPPPDSAPPPPDLAPDTTQAASTRYNFETSLQTWRSLRTYADGMMPMLSRVQGPAWDGQWSLAIAMTGTVNGTHRHVGIAQEFRQQLPANTPITFRVWLPTGDAIEWFQPFVLYYKPADANGNPQFGAIDPPLFPADLPRGQWITITHPVPSNCDSRGVVEVGLEFVLRPSRTATVYVDGVHW